MFTSGYVNTETILHFFIVKSSSIQNSHQYCWNVLTLDAEKSVIPDNCLKELKGNGKHIEQFVKLKRLYSCLSRLKTYKNLKKMLPFEPQRSGCSKTHYWSPTVRRNDPSISESNLIKPFKAVITRVLSSCFCFSANQPGSQSLVIHSVWLSVSLVLSQTVSSSRSE